MAGGAGDEDQLFALRRALYAISGVTWVGINRATGTVTVEYDRRCWSMIKFAAAVRQSGLEAVCDRARNASDLESIRHSAPGRIASILGALVLNAAR